MVKKGNIPWNKGKKCPQTAETMRGVKHSVERIKNQSLGHKKLGLVGPKSPAWKGGCRIFWRKCIFEKDDYTCQNCGSKEKLVAHHIKSFNEYPELRLDLNNGLTLCQRCHYDIHKQIRRRLSW